MATYGSANGKAVIGSTLLVPNVSYKDTPVTITSWSYATTTITLNVASHTFVSGDYIEVSGLTAITNIPNGVHLVTSVTSTTIVFTYALTPTGTAGISSATVKGYVTTNGRVENLGVGQTWQDVTASRVKGTVYVNTTGKPISVAITSAEGSGGTSGLGFLISSNGVDFTYLATTAASGFRTQIYTIIPNNVYYKVDSGIDTIYNWVELR